ncbi:hypothetical protein JW930_05415 [Candidatus Woesearchaeota archaeon]|nr:hypothetical protein [Candidatus Woesearchaeota archaeon]
MKKNYFLCIIGIVLLYTALLVSAVTAATEVTVSLDKSVYFLDEDVAITGTVEDAAQNTSINGTISLSAKAPGASFMLFNTSNFTDGGFSAVYSNTSTKGTYYITAVYNSLTSLTSFEIISNYDIIIEMDSEFTSSDNVDVIVKILNLDTGDYVENEAIIAKIYSATGTEVISHSGNTGTGEYSHTFSALSSGDYFLIINNRQSKRFTVRNYEVDVSLKTRSGYEEDLFKPNEEFIIEAAVVQNGVTATGLSVSYILYNSTNNNVSQGNLFFANNTRVYNATISAPPEQGEYRLSVIVDSIEETKYFEVRSYILTGIPVTIEEGMPRPRDIPFGLGDNILLGLVGYDILNEEFVNPNITAVSFEDVLLGSFENKSYETKLYSIQASSESFNITVLNFTPINRESDYIAHVSGLINSDELKSKLFFRTEEILIKVTPVDTDLKEAHYFRPGEKIQFRVTGFNLSNLEEYNISAAEVLRVEDQGGDEVNLSMVGEAFNNETRILTLTLPSSLFGILQIESLVNNNTLIQNWIKIDSFSVGFYPAKKVFSSSESVKLKMDMKDVSDETVIGAGITIRSIINEATKESLNASNAVSSVEADDEGNYEIKLNPCSEGIYSIKILVDYNNLAQVATTNFEVRDLFVSAKATNEFYNESRIMYLPDRDVFVSVKTRNIDKTPINASINSIKLLYAGTQDNPVWPPKEVNITINSTDFVLPVYTGADGLEYFNISPGEGNFEGGKHIVKVFATKQSSAAETETVFYVQHFMADIEPELTLENYGIHEPVINTTEEINVTLHLCNYTSQQCKAGKPYDSYQNSVDVALIKITNSVTGEVLPREDIKTNKNDLDSMEFNTSGLSEGEYIAEIRINSTETVLYKAVPFIVKSYLIVPDKKFLGHYTGSGDIVIDAVAIAANGDLRSGVNESISRLFYYSGEQKTEIDVVSVSSISDADGRLQINITPCPSYSGFYEVKSLNIPPKLTPAFDVKIFDISYELVSNELFSAYAGGDTIYAVITVNNISSGEGIGQNSIDINYTGIIINPVEGASNSTTINLDAKSDGEMNISFMAPEEEGKYLLKFLAGTLDNKEPGELFFKIAGSLETGNDILESWFGPKTIKAYGGGEYFWLSVANRFKGQTTAENVSLLLQLPLNSSNMPIYYVDPLKIYPVASQVDNVNGIILWENQTISDYIDLNFYAQPLEEIIGTPKVEWEIDYFYSMNGNLSGNVLHENDEILVTDALTSLISPLMVQQENTVYEFSLNVTNIGAQKATDAFIQLWMPRYVLNVSSATDNVIKDRGGNWRVYWENQQIDTGSSQLYNFSIIAPPEDFWIDWSIDYSYSNERIFHRGASRITVGSVLETRFHPSSIQMNTQDQNMGFDIWNKMEVFERISEQCIQFNSKLEDGNNNIVNMSDLDAAAGQVRPLEAASLLKWSGLESLNNQSGVFNETNITMYDKASNTKKTYPVLCYDSTGDNIPNRCIIERDGDYDLRTATDQIENNSYEPKWEPEFYILVNSTSLVIRPNVIRFRESVPIGGQNYNFSVVDRDCDGKFEALYYLESGTWIGPKYKGDFLELGTDEYWITRLQGDIWWAEATFVRKIDGDISNANITLSLPALFSGLRSWNADEINGNAISWYNNIISSGRGAWMDFVADIGSSTEEYQIVNYTLDFIMDSAPYNENGSFVVVNDVLESGFTEEFILCDGNSCQALIKINNTADKTVDFTRMELEFEDMYQWDFLQEINCYDEMNQSCWTNLTKVLKACSNDSDFKCNVTMSAVFEHYRPDNWKDWFVEKLSYLYNESKDSDSCFDDEFKQEARCNFAFELDIEDPECSEFQPDHPKSLEELEHISDEFKQEKPRYSFEFEIDMMEEPRFMIQKFYELCDNYTLSGVKINGTTLDEVQGQCAYNPVTRRSSCAVLPYFNATGLENSTYYINYTFELPEDAVGSTLKLWGRVEYIHPYSYVNTEHEIQDGLPLKDIVRTMMINMPSSSKKEINIEPEELEDYKITGPASMAVNGTLTYALSIRNVAEPLSEKAGDPHIGFWDCQNCSDSTSFEQNLIQPTGAPMPENLTVDLDETNSMLWYLPWNHYEQVNVTPKEGELFFRGDHLYFYAFDSNYTDGQDELNALYISDRKPHLWQKDWWDSGSSDSLPYWKTGDVLNSDWIPLVITDINNNSIKLSNQMWIVGTRDQLDTDNDGNPDKEDFSFVLTDMNSDGIYETVNFDLNQDNDFSTYPGEGPFKENGLVYMGSYYYWIFRIDQWGHGLELMRQDDNDISDANITIDMPSGFSIEGYNGDGVLSSDKTEINWTGIPLLAAGFWGWQQRTFSILTEAPTIETEALVNYSIEYYFQGEKINHNGSLEIKVVEDIINSTEIFPIALQYGTLDSLNFKLDTEENINITKITLTMSENDDYCLSSPEASFMHHDGASNGGCVGKMGSCGNIDPYCKYNYAEWSALVPLNAGESLQRDVFIDTTNNPSDQVRGYYMEYSVSYEKGGKSLTVSGREEVFVGNVLYSWLDAPSALRAGESEQIRLRLENRISNSRSDQRDKKQIEYGSIRTNTGWIVDMQGTESQPLGDTSADIKTVNLTYTNNTQWIIPLDVKNQQENVTGYKSKTGSLTFGDDTYYFYVYDENRDGFTNYTKLMYSKNTPPSENAPAKLDHQRYVNETLEGPDGPVILGISNTTLNFTVYSWSSYNLTWFENGSMQIVESVVFDKDVDGTLDTVCMNLSHTSYDTCKQIDEEVYMPAPSIAANASRLYKVYNLGDNGVTLVRASDEDITANITIIMPNSVVIGSVSSGDVVDGTIFLENAVISTAAEKEIEIKLRVNDTGSYNDIIDATVQWQSEYSIDRNEFTSMQSESLKISKDAIEMKMNPKFVEANTPTIITLNFTNLGSSNILISDLCMQRWPDNDGNITLNGDDYEYMDSTSNSECRNMYAYGSQIFVPAGSSNTVTFNATLNDEIASYGWKHFNFDIVYNKTGVGLGKMRTWTGKDVKIGDVIETWTNSWSMGNINNGYELCINLNAPVEQYINRMHTAWADMQPSDEAYLHFTAIQNQTINLTDIDASEWDLTAAGWPVESINGNYKHLEGWFDNKWTPTRFRVLLVDTVDDGDIYRNACLIVPPMSRNLSDYPEDTWNGWSNCSDYKSDSDFSIYWTNDTAAFRDDRWKIKYLEADFSKNFALVDARSDGLPDRVYYNQSGGDWTAAIPANFSDELNIDGTNYRTYFGRWGWDIQFVEASQYDAFANINISLSDELNQTTTSHPATISGKQILFDEVYIPPFESICLEVYTNNQTANATINIGYNFQGVEMMHTEQWNMSGGSG